jgi:arylsulfatase A-like enzyme
MPLLPKSDRTPFPPLLMRGLLHSIATLIIAAGCLSWCIVPLFADESAKTQRRPSIVLILADDQGYGDVGFHGNPKIRTPHLDRLAKQGIELTHFYVSPVCSPTRASLLTGRYNYRTGAIDTYLGRSLMYPDEVTLAELLRAAGYRTGIFGKWHLGDNYPLRPIDQGFDEALVNRGGGIGQPSDPPGGGHYTDPILQHNGRGQPTKGYVSDIVTDAALEFIAKDRQRPFFVYLPYNCPHTPLEAPEDLYRQYREMDLTKGPFSAVGRPLPKKANTDDTARVYAMLTNIDDNVGRLLARLEELGLTRDTIVVFLSDNGPQQPRYNAGLRGRKGSVYEGGIRVPCLMRWPAHLPADKMIDACAAHIDLLPTLLSACGVEKPAFPAIDGIDLMPLLMRQRQDLPERTLCFQWHRGDVPEMNRACAARRGRFKLVQPLGANGEPLPAPLKFELYDIESDPFEMHDLAAEQPDAVVRLRREYEAWFRDVSATRGYAPVRIALGTPHENPVVLTRQDWRGERAGWGPKNLGHWEVDVAAAGQYDVTLRFAAAGAAGTARFSLGPVQRETPIAKGDRECRFSSLPIAAGAGRLEASIITDGTTDGRPIGVQYVEVRRVD